jgi:hypothetical protein
MAWLTQIRGTGRKSQKIPENSGEFCFRLV